MSIVYTLHNLLETYVQRYPAPPRYLWAFYKQKSRGNMKFIWQDFARHSDTVVTPGHAAYVVNKKRFEAIKWPLEKDLGR